MCNYDAVKVQNALAKIVPANAKCTDIQLVGLWMAIVSIISQLCVCCRSPCMNMYQSKSTQNVPYTIFLLGAIR